MAETPALLADQDRSREIYAWATIRQTFSICTAGSRKHICHADIDAAQFHRFFDDKVDGVRSTSDALPPSFSPNPSAALFDQFQSVTVMSLPQFVHCLTKPACALYPLPTTHQPFHQVTVERLCS